MTGAGFTFDLLTVVLMAGVIAMVVSTTLMVVDMMPHRRRGPRGDEREPTLRRLSPAAARLIAQARERAALNSSDPSLIASQLGLDGEARPPAANEVTLLQPPPAGPDTIVLPPGAVSIAPRPTEHQLALPPGPVFEVPEHRVPPVKGPVIDVPVLPNANERLSFYEASNLAQHLALNDPDRIVDVIKQWLQNDTRVYEEDV